MCHVGMLFFFFWAVANQDTINLNKENFLPLFLNYLKELRKAAWERAITKRQLYLNDICMADGYCGYLVTKFCLTLLWPQGL